MQHYEGLINNLPIFLFEIILNSIDESYLLKLISEN